jgi:F1F0 ATPase subunit 2
MSLLAAALAGAGLGLFYFGGLWLSVRQVISRPNRTGWLAASHVARFALLGWALAALCREGPSLLVAALVGLWLARSYLVCKLGGFHHGS